jgi:ATP-dependent helicase/nuclease subunit B
MAEAQWEALGPHQKVEATSKSPRSHEAHPQFHLKLLLDRMGIRRDELQNAAPSAAESKNRQIADIFCLPSDTANWREAPRDHKQMPSVALMEVADSAQEARAIAIKVRESLETAGARVALVTPDRELALRVAAQLRRWSVGVDDSAGTPVLQTPQGRLISIIGEAISDSFSPVSLLAIAKHPLVKAGDGRLDWLEQARALDIVLRGPPAGGGLAAIDGAIQKKAGSNEALKHWWRGFVETLSPLTVASKKTFGDVMDAIQQVAGNLTDGNIWKGVAGRQLAMSWEEITASDLSVIGAIEQAAIPALLSELFGNAVVRPPYGGHPRIAIYGLLEARMQQADIIICGGLNETSWPQIAQPDPWLAPAIRRHLGLATLDRNIGLSAHDLATALGAKEVLLTRAKRDRGGPTVASRFVLRIKAFLGEALIRDSRYSELANYIDLPAQQQPLATRPEPQPDADQRKVAMSVTDFDQLKSDPYSFYAKRILGLRVLEPVNADPSHAWRGTLVHDILERWFKDDRCAPDALIARAGDMLTNPALDPVLRTLWQPRIASGLRWIAEETRRMLDDGRSLLVAEQTGQITLLGVPIKGRADRIDRLPDNGLAIIDYKTGIPPKTKQVKAGFALQLGLIGLIAESDAIAGVSGKAGRFEYWSLAKNKDRGFGYLALPTANKASEKSVGAEDFIAFVREQAETALRNWIIGNAPFTAKLHPDYANYEDYDQLMRLQEWNGRQPIADGDEA